MKTSLLIITLAMASFAAQAPATTAPKNAATAVKSPAGASATTKASPKKHHKNVKKTAATAAPAAAVTPSAKK